MKHIYFFILFFTVHFSVFPQKLTNERARWFTDSRFGMFIHWGVYSGAEGIWKGEKLRNDNIMPNGSCTGTLHRMNM